MNIKPTILSHQKRADGKYPVKIRIYHHGTTSYASTDLTVAANKVSKDGDIKDLKVLRVCADIVDKYEDIVARHYFEVSAMDTANEVRDFLVEKSKPFRLDFLAWADELIQHKINQGRTGTANIMRRAVDAFKDYLQLKSLDTSSMTASMMIDFMRHMTQPHRVKIPHADAYKMMTASENTARSYVIHLRIIFRAARKKYNIDTTNITNDPFESLDLTRRTPREHGYRALTVEEVRKIFLCKPETKSEMLGRDVFCISFALCGVNVKDIFYMPAFVNGRAEYCRLKTKGRRFDNAFTSVKVPEEIAEEVARWSAVLSPDRAFRFCDMYETYDSFANSTVKGLHKLEKSLGIEHLTSYYARHSWASIARNECNAHIEDVAAGLNHAATDDMTDRYIKRDFSRIDELNAKVLKLVLGE